MSHHQDWKPVIFSNKTTTTPPHTLEKKRGRKSEIPQSVKLDANGDFPEHSPAMGGATKKKALGQQISAMRIIKGWTQKQLAQELNITEVAVKNYENNKDEVPGRIKTILQKKTGIKFT